MRHLGAVIAAGALFVLVASCAKQGAVSAGSGLTTTVASPTSTVVTGPAMPGVHLPPGAVPVPGRQVDAHALPGSFPREVWTEQGGTVVGFYGVEGGCFTSGASMVAQTGTEVTIRLIQQKPGTGETMCPLYVGYKPMSVTLAAPLGTRTVVFQMLIERG
jgi:hypothetical protein